MKTKLSAVEIVGWTLSIAYLLLTLAAVVFFAREVYLHHRVEQERREWIKSKQASPHEGHYFRENFDTNGNPL